MTAELTARFYIAVLRMLTILVIYAAGMPPSAGYAANDAANALIEELEQIK